MFKYQDIANRLSLSTNYVYDIDSIRNSIERLFSTQRGQAVGEPTYGAGIIDYLYNPIVEDMEVFLEMAVKQALYEWEPKVTLEEIKVNIDYDLNTISVTMKLYCAEFNQFIVLQQPYDVAA